MYMRFLQPLYLYNLDNGVIYEKQGKITGKVVVQKYFIIGTLDFFSTLVYSVLSTHRY